MEQVMSQEGTEDSQELQTLIIDDVRNIKNGIDIWFPKMAGYKYEIRLRVAKAIGISVEDIDLTHEKTTNSVKLTLEKIALWISTICLEHLGRLHSQPTGVFAEPIDLVTLREEYWKIKVQELLKKGEETKESQPIAA